MTPGRNCSTTTSARRASFRRISCPSTVFKSTASERFPRFTIAKGYETSWMNGGTDRIVAELRVLDLDDVRAEVAQELRAERPREEAREIQDRDALEGRRHGGSKSRSRYQSSCTPDLPVAVLRCLRNLRYRRGRGLAEVEAIRHVIRARIALAQRGEAEVHLAKFQQTHVRMEDEPLPGPRSA